MTNVEKIQITKIQEGDLPFLYVTEDKVSGNWVTVCDYTVILRWESQFSTGFDHCTLTIPCGFSFRASVPGFIGWVFPPAKLTTIAPMIHDFLYSNFGYLPPTLTNGRFKFLSRLEVDNIFLHLMRRAGVSNLRSYLAYQAVRAFGSFPWKHHQSEI